MKQVFKFGLAPFRKFNIKGKIKRNGLYVWGGTAKRKPGKNEPFFFGKLNLVTNYFVHKGLLLNNIEEKMVAFTTDRIVSKDIVSLGVGLLIKEGSVREGSGPRWSTCS